MGISRESREVPAPSPAMGLPCFSSLGFFDFQVHVRRVIFFCAFRVFRFSETKSAKKNKAQSLARFIDTLVPQIAGDATLCPTRSAELTQCLGTCSSTDGSYEMHLIIPQPSTTDLPLTMSNRVFEYVEHMLTCTSARERGVDLVKEIELKRANFAQVYELFELQIQKHRDLQWCADKFKVDPS